MSDDLERALSNYAHREQEGEAALPENERRERAESRAAQAVYDRNLKNAVEGFQAVEQVVATINGSSAGRIPKITEKSRTSSGEAACSIPTSVAYGFPTVDGKTVEDVLEFNFDPDIGFQAVIVTFDRAEPKTPVRKSLGYFGGTATVQIRSMFAAYLEQKAT